MELMGAILLLLAQPQIPSKPALGVGIRDHHISMTDFPLSFKTASSQCGGEEGRDCSLGPPQDSTYKKLLGRGCQLA